jgi:Uma2 family endonuclease
MLSFPAALLVEQRLSPLNGVSQEETGIMAMGEHAMTLLQRRQDLITGEELSRMPDLGPCELVEGRIVPMPPTSYAHGEIEADVSAALKAYARGIGKGRIMAGEVGIYVRCDPDTVRAADVLFISNERYARRESASYLDVAPELVVEILSPDDLWSEVMEKLSDYFVAGVDAVWVINPRRKEVFSYRSLTEVQRFGEGQILTDEEILPGFVVSVSELFRG